MHSKLTFLLFAIAFSVHAEPVTDFVNAKKSGDHFEMEGATVLSSEFIPIEAMKDYQLSGFFKNAQGVPVKLLFGVASFDAAQKEINVASVSPVVGTDTVLTQDCNPEDKVIRVKDASAWKSEGLSTVAFETNPDLTDLPNDHFSPSNIESITQQDGFWEITFKEVSGRDYSAGTPVRQHYHGNTFVYPAISELPPNSEWEEVKGVLKESTDGIQSPFDTKHLRRGSAFVKIVILGEPSNTTFLFKDIDFSRAD